MAIENPEINGSNLIDLLVRNAREMGLEVEKKPLRNSYPDRLAPDWMIFNRYIKARDKDGIPFESADPRIKSIRISERGMFPSDGLNWTAETIIDIRELYGYLSFGLYNGDGIVGIPGSLFSSNAATAFGYNVRDNISDPYTIKMSEARDTLGELTKKLNVKLQIETPKSIGESIADLAEMDVRIAVRHLMP